MVGRRQVLGALLGGIAAAACGARQASGPAPALPPPLALDPLVDLVPAAGLDWLVDARPCDILAEPLLAALLAAAVPADPFDTFALRHGGVDLRRADQLVVSGHGRATLGLAKVPIEPARIEAAFARRARLVEGRAVQRGVTRFWGTVGDEREQVATFGHDAVGIERGALGPLQAAIYFAQGRLKRARPALRAEPLQSAAARLGEGPVRGFARGPFEGAWKAGLGGLLGASTAMAARLGADAGAGAGSGLITLRLLLLGGWGDQAPAAAERLAAAFRLLLEDPLGRLAGLHRPVTGPGASNTPDALALDVAFDAVRMTAGVHAVIGASVAEIMAF